MWTNRDGQAESERKAQEKAKEVNSLSLKYHLSHATFACNILLENEREAMGKKYAEKVEMERKQIQAELEQMEQTAEAGEQRRLQLTEKHKQLLREQYEILSAFQNLRIYVGYLDCLKEEARTVFDPEKNFLQIWLPKPLLEAAMQNGAYTEKVAELRAFMAHELGHAILHADKLANTSRIYGSKAFQKNSPEEREAEIFCETLLRLRRERNRKMREDGTGALYF